MRRFISSITAAALAVGSLPCTAAVAESESESAGRPLKVMCIGDSITDGYMPEYAGSYRKFVYNDLRAMGYDVDMVGVKDDIMLSYTDPDSGETFEYDNANVGYSGYSVKSYPGRNGIFEVLQSTDCLKNLKPDVVTLMIGTNNIIDNHDMDETCADMEELIGFILENIPEDSILLVSGIQEMEPNRPGVYDWFSNYRHSPDWQTPISDEVAADTIEKNVNIFNGNVGAWVITHSAEKDDPLYKKLYLLYDEPYIYGDVLSEYLFDGVHPNNAGYAVLGHAWADRIDGCIRQHDLEMNPPQITAATTAATTAVTTTVTTTEAVTTEPALEEIPLKIADMVMLNRYLLGMPGLEYKPERMKMWDLDEDGRLSVFDMALMRILLTDQCDKMTKKMKEMFGDDWTLLGENENVIYIPEDNEWYVEPEKSTVGSSSSGSHNIVGSLNTSIEEEETTQPDYSKLLTVGSYS